MKKLITGVFEVLLSDPINKILCNIGLTFCAIFLISVIIRIIFQK
ncbi:MAG: hypothetical protein WCG93_13645 [Paludibacter sp.]